MRSLRSLFLVAVAAMSAACAHTPHISVDGAALGRVVIYRNGVAFYERNAVVENGKLQVHVPRDRVDDFLKSLTIVDMDTKKPLAVSIPRKEDDGGTFLTMTVETNDRAHVPVQMTYVTEAPAWKPSYRVVVGEAGKVMLEGWAIVDNVSGEDWNKVMVGVGASSAMSFRYDLWSVRRVDRDLLEGEARFAVAPPTGLSPYDVAGEEVAELDGNDAADLGVSFSGASSVENNYVVDGVNTTGIGRTTTQPAAPAPTGGLRGVVSDTKNGRKLAGVTVIATSPALGQTQTAITDDTGSYQIANLPPGKYMLTYYYGDTTVEQTNVDVKKDAFASASAKISSNLAGGEVIAVRGTAPMIDPTSTSQGVTIDRNYIKNVPVPGRSFEAALGAAAGSQGDGGSSGGSSGGGKSAQELAHQRTVDNQAKLEASANKIVSAHKDVVVEAHGSNEQVAKARAAAVRTRLIDAGVPAARIHISPKVGAGESDRVRLVAVAPNSPAATTAPPTASSHGPISDTPVGESRFMADRPMTVKAGTSAMVAMVHGETSGGVVYLYDPISDRGDERFAFRSVRLDNPTGDTLEPGPVTVYGDGRFIGEGITEPVPPHASVVVPFALDKQIMVSRHGEDDDRIAKLETVQRGVVTAEIQHRRTTTFTVSSRLAEPAKVFVRHKLEAGWTITDAPPRSMKVGDSDLFEIDLAAGETRYVTIAEATPVERSLELASDAALDMMKVYIQEPNSSPELRAQVGALIDTHRKGADLVDKIATLRDELVDYQQRSGELHAQLVTLKAVHTGGELMTSLKQKLIEISDRTQKLTISIVDAQEQLMLTRVRFQNQIAELKLTDATTPPSVSKR